MKEDKNISLISHFLTFEFFDMSLANCWKQTNKQTIDSNAVSKVFNRKRWTGQSFSKMKTPANIAKKEYFYVCVRHVTLFLSVVRGWVWPSFGWVWPFSSGCGWVWVSMIFFGWVWVCVTFSWLGVGGCGWVWPFFGWVWVSVTFFWLGVGECDLFLAGCGWVWVSVTFFWLSVGGCGLVWVSVGGCGWVHGL